MTTSRSRADSTGQPRASAQNWAREGRSWASMTMWCRRRGMGSVTSAGRRAGTSRDLYIDPLLEPPRLDPRPQGPRIGAGSGVGLRFGSSSRQGPLAGMTLRRIAADPDVCPAGYAVVLPQLLVDLDRTGP